MARSDTRPSSPGIVPHPAYTTWAPIWQQLFDVYEGAGGFTDTTRPYLYAHPREWLDHSLKQTATESEPEKWVSNPNPRLPSPKLLTRRRIARYEPIASTLIDQLKAALFRKAAVRSFEDPQKIKDEHPLRRFWADADGSGRKIDAVMQDAWTAAAVFGHMLLYADRAGETPATSTRADQPPVVLRSYTPLDLIDWLTNDLGQLTAVRLLEAAPREDFDLPAAAAVAIVRDVNATEWTTSEVKSTRAGFKPTGKASESGSHGFGVLPVRMLYARRRPLTPTIGRSVLGDPALYIDLYNLISEVRELLRNQTFAILNVPLGKEGSVEVEAARIGQTAGTANVLFSGEPAQYVSPEGVNVQVYHEHIDRLVRTIYRLAVVAWESDSLDAESGDSRRLKKEDLHQMLAGYADECEQAEIGIAQLVYRAHYGESWQTQWDADRPSISYPDEFDVTGLADELDAATAAIAMELGETATKEIKKRIVPKVLPNLPQPTMATIEEEIQAAEVLTAQDKQRELMEMKGGLLGDEAA